MYLMKLQLMKLLKIAHMKKALLLVEVIVLHLFIVMNKINIASEEQASGVQQINSTINEMDGITQENAQYAENNIKISQTTAEQAIHLENLMNMFKVSEDQPKIAQPDNQQIEMASDENPALLGQQKEVNVKDFEEKDNFK